MSKRTLSSLTISFKNSFPRSERRVRGAPNRQMIFSISRAAIVEALLSGIGNASGHLVNRSINTQIYLSPFSVGGSGPIKSTAQSEAGSQLNFKCVHEVGTLVPVNRGIFFN